MSSNHVAPAPVKPDFFTALQGAVMRTLNRPQFVAAFIVLLVAAVSLNAATQYLRLYFKKERVELVKPLEQIPVSLGPWIQISKDQPLNAEMLDVLGTKAYIFRDYLDSRIVKPEVIAEINGNEKTAGERAQMLGQIRMRQPAAHVRMAVTYYTGMVDTVAHIPDRCYVADGMVPDVKETPVWKAANRLHEPIDVRVSSIHFEEAEGRGAAITKNVAYFFHCNGEYEHDAISGVRMRLQNLAERHAYYAKIEVMTEMRDRAVSDQTLADFLTNALPEVENCLPDWQKVKASAAAVATAGK
ncbi:MAG: exosortase-associated EpsI family protein [Anaerolineae bacterium]|nr:exosortase-associated EpsI family protein [Phycisphaerae bacterium]